MVSTKLAIALLGFVVVGTNADFCSFTTRSTPYPQCEDCGLTALRPACVGRNARLESSAPIRENNICLLKCNYTCTIDVGVDCCPGYHGPDCDIDINACDSTPCGANMDCFDSPAPAGADASGRSCQCRAGYALSRSGVGCVVNISAVVNLKQSDFTSGSYIIDKPGAYRFSEDIVFNPNSKASGGNNMPKKSQLNTNDPAGPYDARAFGLGFFAAIVVKVDHVTIDLNGHSIKQSVEHRLQQRFYAHVELADSIFNYDQGPHNFTNTQLRAASHVVIENGVMGRSSHHGIHGHNNTNVLIRNMTIRDFEVAAISLNGAVALNIEGVAVGPGSHDVPVKGIFSTGRFILPYVEAIVQKCPSAAITIEGRAVMGAEILQKLSKVLDDTYNAVVCGAGEIPPLVNNLDVNDGNGLPDGSAIYGIVLHTYGSHTNGFVPDRHNETCIDINGEVVGMVDEFDGGMGYQRCVRFVPSNNVGIRIHNVTMQGLDIRVNEVEALAVNKFDATSRTWPATAQVDVVGAVYQYEINVDGQGNFAGNDISNAQLFVAANIDCIKDPEEDMAGQCLRKRKRQTQGSCQRGELGGNPASLATSLNTITAATLAWAARGGSNGDVSSNNCLVIGGGDNMFHVNKGAMGLRIDGGSNVDIRNVEIDTVRNFGKPVGTQCMLNPNLRRHPLQTQPWYTGTDSIGFSCSSCRYVEMLGANKVRNIISTSGNAYAYQFIHHTDYIRGSATIGQINTLQAGNLYPNLSPAARYADRPYIRKLGGPPIADVIFIDDYACIPGDGMDMDNSSMMGGMTMPMDENAPPDPHTMTCGVIINMERSTSPALQYTRSDLKMTSSCPASSLGANNVDDAATVSSGLFIAVVVIVGLILVAALLLVLKKAMGVKSQRLERPGSLSFENPNHYTVEQTLDSTDA